MPKIDKYKQLDDIFFKANKYKDEDDDSSYDKLNKTIKDFNDYLAKIKKEVDLNEHSLAIHYDYDIVPLPDDIIDEAYRKENK